MRRLIFVIAILVVAVQTLQAQSPEQAVAKANEALLAASRAGDTAAYSRLAGEDLRWVDADGRVLTRAQRLALITGPSTAGRSFRDVDVKVYGTVAVLFGRSDWTSNGKKLSERVQRVFVNRGGQWQLVSHSTTPMDASAR